MDYKFPYGKKKEQKKIEMKGSVPMNYAEVINDDIEREKNIEKAFKEKNKETNEFIKKNDKRETEKVKSKDLKKMHLEESLFDEVDEALLDLNMPITANVTANGNSVPFLNGMTTEKLEDKKCFTRNRKQVKEAAVLDEPTTRKEWELQDKRNNKDIWSDIYNELVDMKGVETPHRKLKTDRGQRYKASWEDEGSVRVGVDPNDDAILVKADDEAQLDFAKQVADTYGVEYRVREHTSRYADARYVLKIYPFKKVTESLNESNENKAYGEVIKHFQYGVSGDILDVFTDLVDRAVSNVEDGNDLEEAVMNAVDEGLIYYSDIWKIKEHYEEPELLDETFESLYNDIYSIASNLVNSGDVDEGLTKAERHNRKMDKIFQDKKDRDTRMSKFLKDNSNITDDELKKVQDDDKVGLELKNRGLHDRYWNEVEGKNESLKESYTEVDTIDDGVHTYRVVGGGFNTNNALVPVEGKNGNTIRIHMGDVVEFFTWYDKKGNVIHEPSAEDAEESLNEETSKERYARQLSANIFNLLTSDPQQDHDFEYALEMVTGQDTLNPSKVDNIETKEELEKFLLKWSVETLVQMGNELEKKFGYEFIND